VAGYSDSSAVTGDVFTKEHASGDGGSGRVTRSLQSITVEH
jgi:hypothetical protein